jgi:hypothetical protein
MTKKQKSTMQEVRLRVFGGREDGQKFIDEISMVMASTFGPVVINTLIQNGFDCFNREKKPRRKSGKK